MENPNQTRIFDPKALTLVPDVKTTRRLKRHIVYDPKGRILYPARTIEEALDFLSSADVNGFWLAAGSRPIWVSLQPAASPLPDPNQPALFEPETTPNGSPDVSPLDVLSKPAQ